MRASQGELQFVIDLYLRLCLETLLGSRFAFPFLTWFVPLSALFDDEHLVHTSCGSSHLDCAIRLVNKLFHCALVLCFVALLSHPSCILKQNKN